VADLYGVRRGLETEAAARAVGRIPAAEIQSMRAATEQVGPSVLGGEPLAFIELDIPFHDLWIRHCRNALLIQYMDRLRDHIRRASNLASSLTESSAQAYGEHLVILDALEGGTAEDFCAAVDRHIAQVAERMVLAFPSSGSSDREP
jgi:DNA-binding GntR family transcriptional regulator